MEHTAGPVPRLCAFFILQAQQLQTINVGLHPIFTVPDVFVEVLDQLSAKRVKRICVHVLGQVGIKSIRSFFGGQEINLKTTHTNTH